MISRTAPVRLVASAIGLLVLMSVQASAQYNMTVNQPVANQTYPVGSIPLDVDVFWAGISANITGLDVKILVMGNNQIDPLLVQPAPTVTSTSFPGSPFPKINWNYAYTANVNTIYPYSLATVVYEAYRTVGGVKTVVATKSVIIQLKP